MTNIQSELTLDMHTQFQVDYAGTWVDGMTLDDGMAEL